MIRCGDPGEQTAQGPVSGKGNAEAQKILKKLEEDKDARMALQREDIRKAHEENVAAH